MKTRIRFLVVPGLIAALCVLPVVSAFAAGTWHQASRMDEGRVLLQATLDGSDIYVAGGSGISGPKSAFDLYDTETQMWRPLPPMPTARERFGMASFSGRIYVSGGRASQIEEDDIGPSDALWVYDSVSRDWVLMADMPSTRLDHAMINIGDKLYVIGGTGVDASKIYIYDIVTDKWEVSPVAMSVPRKGFGFAHDGDKIFIVGGVTLKGALSGKVETFDTVSGQWSTQAPLPDPRVGLAAAFIAGRLHVAGGSVPDPAKTFNAHYSIADGEKAWTTEANMPTARHSMASVAGKDKWYVLGGGAAAGFYTLFAAADAVEVFVAE